MLSAKLMINNKSSKLFSIIKKAIEVNAGGVGGVGAASVK